MKKDIALDVTKLKILLWVYILLCILIAGIHYGYADKASPSISAGFLWLWHFYENELKVLFFIYAGYLTLKILRKSQRTKMQGRNLIGLFVTALIVHLILPIVTGNNEFYFFSMPLPWTTTPLQLLHEGSVFYLEKEPLWGALGITSVMIFYALVTVVVFVGTLLFGRRWQCSTLCLFNGFVSEAFSPCFPLIGKKKELTTKQKKIMMVVKWVFFVMGIFFSAYWALVILGYPIDGWSELLGSLEIYKYLLGELFVAMFFWIAFTGRGYCYYCPLGVLLSFISKAAGQRIETNETKCIQCGKCNKACPMGIDIETMAKEGLSVKDLSCVGCGHCVDVCPVETLSYKTNFLALLR
jgi:ferredoxin-type protein NapH